MLPAVRRETLTRMLLEQKNLSVVDAASRLQVSEETVRRDFKQLEREGVLSRTHGGAVLNNLVARTVTNDDLAVVMIEAKTRIATQAARLLRPGACIYLDSSTTSLTLAQSLGALPLTVVSNSLAILEALSHAEAITLVGIGGTLSKTRRCFVGRAAKELLRNYHFDLVFLSARSIDRERGVTDSSEEEIEIKQTVTDRTNRLVLLVDYTKFDRASFARICPIAQVDDLITDREPSREWQDYCQEHHVRLTWPPSEG